jgi:hypothetical protein
MSKLALVLFTFSCLAYAYIPADGIVPNKEVAVKVAETILTQIYGQKVVEERPFVAILKDEIWIVDGTFHCASGNSCMGGVAHIEISKKDGRVINVTHGK